MGIFGAGSQLCSFLALILTEAPVNGNSSKVWINFTGSESFHWAISCHMHNKHSKTPWNPWTKLNSWVWGWIYLIKWSFLPEPPEVSLKPCSHPLMVQYWICGTTWLWYYLGLFLPCNAAWPTCIFRCWEHRGVPGRLLLTQTTPPGWVKVAQSIARPAHSSQVLLTFLPKRILMISWSDLLHSTKLSIKC